VSQSRGINHRKITNKQQTVCTQMLRQQQPQQSPRTHNECTLLVSKLEIFICNVMHNKRTNTRKALTNSLLVTHCTNINRNRYA